MAVPESTMARVGDAMLWAWGECRRSGRLEAALCASVAALDEDGTPRAPGTHSNPTLSRILAAESEETERGGNVWTALRVEREMGHWRKDRHKRLWVKVAEAYYAGPHARDNAQVGRLLNIAERTVDGIRRQMRRWLQPVLARACNAAC